MPRSKSFNENETLREIGQLFWRNGYSATAIDQICEHVSLSKPSIYNAYGDKASLFRKVVDWYADEMGKQGVAMLKSEAAVSEEIAGLLRHFLVCPPSEIVSHGCLLTSASMELQFIEPELFAYVSKRIDEVRDAIKAYLANARRVGLLKSECDPCALSEYVFTLFQGLRMQSRTSAGQINLERTIATAMGPLIGAEASVNREH